MILPILFLSLSPSPQPYLTMRHEVGDHSYFVCSEDAERKLWREVNHNGCPNGITASIHEWDVKVSNGHWHCIASNYLFTLADRDDTHCYRFFKDTRKGSK